MHAIQKISYDVLAVTLRNNKTINAYCSFHVQFNYYLMQANTKRMIVTCFAKTLYVCMQILTYFYNL